MNEKEKPENNEPTPEDCEAETETSEPSPPEPKPKITVVETIYHQLPGEQADAVTSRYVRELETFEQVYTRKLTADENWQPLIPETCWVKDVSLIHIRNEEGTKLTKNPTDEERAEFNAMILEVGTVNADWLVLAGESFRGAPISPSRLEIRSQSGAARFTLTVFPR